MKKLNTNKIPEAQIMSETKIEETITRFEMRAALHQNKIQFRIIAKDSQDKIHFDKIGITAELPDETLKQVPINEQILLLLEITFIKGIEFREDMPNIQFEKIINKLDEKNG